MHIDYKGTRIKQYHKEGQALRTEATINNARDFYIGKRLCNLDKLRQTGFQANRRLLEVEKISHDCILTEEQLQRLHHSLQIDRQRASALRFGDRKVHALWHSLVLFDLLPSGFSNGQLRIRLAPLLGLKPEQLTPGQMTYHLRRLRLHGLIERVPHSLRYRLTSLGLRVALFFTRTYDSLLRPGLGVILPAFSGSSTPLRRAFDKIDSEVNAWIAQTRMAA